MAVMADVVASVRQKLRDFPRAFSTDINGDDMVQILELPVLMVEPTTLRVQLLNEFNELNLLNPDADFTLDAHHGDVVLNAPLASTNSVNIFGYHYQWFLDSDIADEGGWWITAMEQSVSDTSMFDNLTLDDPRFELVVRGVLVQALWSLLVEASLDIDVRNPEGVDVPTSQRFSQLQQLVQLWTARYEELASQLNLGLDRIQMLTLRRTSLTTGRLVPVYNAQEFDDQATPQRRFPLIDTDQLMDDPPRPSTIPPPENTLGF